MATLAPLVLEGVDLTAFIQYVVDNHAQPSTIVVCCTEEALLEQLYAATKGSLHTRPQHRDEEGSADVTHAETPSNEKRRDPWRVPTLRLLATSRTVKLAFCSDVTHLRAYLATYAHNVSKQARNGSVPDRAGSKIPILAILSPIQLHRPTSAFSAQGLNRTFTAAVEAAHKTGSRLVFTECPNELPLTHSDDLPATEEDMLPENSTIANTWDEEVSILNVTTKTFGAGERGWVGRTVKIRTIAARWCRFERLGESEY